MPEAIVIVGRVPGGGRFPMETAEFWHPASTEPASSCLDVRHSCPSAGNFIHVLLHPSSSYSSFNMKPKHYLLCRVFLNCPCQLSSPCIPQPFLIHREQFSCATKTIYLWVRHCYLLACKPPHSKKISNRCFPDILGVQQCNSCS